MMREIAKSLAREWCYPEEHHSMGLVLTWHCADDSKSARIPRIDIRGVDGWVASYTGDEAVQFLAALNRACQDLLK